MVNDTVGSLVYRTVLSTALPMLSLAGHSPPLFSGAVNFSLGLRLAMIQRFALRVQTVA